LGNESPEEELDRIIMSYSWQRQNVNIDSELPALIPLTMNGQLLIENIGNIGLSSMKINTSAPMDDDDIEPLALLNMTKLATDMTINNTSDDILIFTHIYNNSSNTSLLPNDQQFISREVMYIIITSLILGFLTLSTVIGNVFVIAAILLERNLRTVGNYLVLSLAVADLMVACLVMPLGAVYEVAQGWTLGRVLCDLWTSADVLCCTASILHLLAIAMVCRDHYFFDKLSFINISITPKLNQI